MSNITFLRSRIKKSGNSGKHLLKETCKVLGIFLLLLIRSPRPGYLLFFKSVNACYCAFNALFAIFSISYEPCFIKIDKLVYSVSGFSFQIYKY